MNDNNRFGLGAFVCIFNRDYSKILLLYRNAEKRERWGAKWGNIGGVVEFGETSLQAVVREAKEEIGVKIAESDLKLIRIKETLNFMPHLQAVHFVYATALDESTKITLNAGSKTAESEGYEWFRVDKIPDSTLDPVEDIMEWRELAMEDCSLSKRQR